MRKMIEMNGPVTPLSRLSRRPDAPLLQRAVAALLVTLSLGLVFTGLLPLSAARASSSMTVNAASAHGRHLSVGLNKSIIIETPTDVRDVLVSNPEIADAVVRTNRRVYIIGMKIGQSNIVLFDGHGGQIASFDIDVARDNGALAALIRKMIPNSDIQVEGVGEGVVLSGSVKTPSDAEKAMDLAANYVGDRTKVSNYLSVEAKEQVQLRVTVAEVEHTVLKQLGVNLQGAIDKGSVVAAGLIDTPFSSTLQSLSGTELGMRIGSNTNGVAGTLRAMERSGLIRTLAEPNLTAISGEKADFLAGGEFPIPSGISESGRVSVEFKSFGIALGFRPVVMSENRISLQVKTEVSEISSDTTVRMQALTIPGLKVRRSSTTLELPSGGTMAMAGLLNDEVRKSIDGFPGLKDLPILGALFRSVDYRRSQTELVIFVTPYIVQPVARSQTALPTQNVTPTSDMNSIFLGQLTRRYDMSGGTGRRGVKYHGSFGYSYE